MNKIYVLKNDKIMSGPYTLDALKERGLKSTEKVWYEGLVEWQPANFLSGYGVTILTVEGPKEKKGFMKSLLRSSKPQ